MGHSGVLFSIPCYDCRCKEKEYISTQVKLGEDQTINVTMNRGSKHANCISLLTKRMENARKDVTLSEFEISGDDEISKKMRIL